MTGDVMQAHTFGQLCRNIGLIGFQCRKGIAMGCGFPIKQRVNLQQHFRIMIGGPPQHDAVKLCQMRQALRQRGQATIEDNRNMWIFTLDLMHKCIVERRNIAVFLRAQAFEPGLAGMDNQKIGSRLQRRGDKSPQCDFGVLFVDANAAFNGDRNLHHGFHCGHACAHQGGFSHHAGTKSAILHPVRRTAAIQIDLVIAHVFR